MLKKQFSFSAYSKIALALYSLWILIYYEQLYYPVMLSELDYLRFLQYDSLSNPQIWSKHFFTLADGHPSLLSLGLSFIYKITGSFFVLRLVILISNFFAFFYFFKWCKRLNIMPWITFFLGAILLFAPLHTPLITSAIGDFLGFSLLLGWLYLRTEEKRFQAMLLLFLAVMIRETHVIPALAYIIVMMLTNVRDLKRNNLWGEVVPILALAIFFMTTKITTDSWYAFSGKNVLESFWIHGIKKPVYLFVYLRLIIFIFLIALFWNSRKRITQKPLFNFYYLSIISTVLIIFISLPYLATAPKARLLTPFLAPVLISALMTIQKLKPSITLFFILIFGTLEFQFERIKLGNHYADTQMFYKFLEKLKPSTTGVVSGNWPYNIYNSYPNYGYPKVGSVKNNLAFSTSLFSHIYEGKPPKYSKDEKILFYLSPHVLENEMLNYLCTPDDKCSTVFLKDRHKKNHMFYYRNYHLDDLKLAWSESKN